MAPSPLPHRAPARKNSGKKSAIHNLCSVKKSVLVIITSIITRYVVSTRSPVAGCWNPDCIAPGAELRRLNLLECFRHAVAPGEGKENANQKPQAPGSMYGVPRSLRTPAFGSNARTPLVNLDWESTQSARTRRTGDTRLLREPDARLWKVQK